MEPFFSLVISFALNFASFPAQSVDVRLECSDQVVRMGDSFTLDVWVDNSSLHNLAGYQVGFGWGADKLELTSEPELLPHSVLNDFFGHNAPPFGNGYSSCPDFGDGLEREGLFALGVSLSMGSPFASGHLFRCNFRARQAIDSVPQMFVIDEFAACIGQPTIVTDWSASNLPLNFIEAQVEVVPNLQSSSTFAIGSVADFELHDLPNTPYNAGLSLVPGHENLGSMGELFFDRFHSTFSIFSTGATSASGVANFNASVPSLSALVGRTVYMHTLSGTSSGRRLSNLFSAIIQP